MTAGTWNVTRITTLAPDQRVRCGECGGRMRHAFELERRGVTMLACSDCTTDLAPFCHVRVAVNTLRDKWRKDDRGRYRKIASGIRFVVGKRRKDNLWFVRFYACGGQDRMSRMFETFAQARAAVALLASTGRYTV